MARVIIPSLMRDLTAGQGTVEATGHTVAEVIAALDALYPGFQARLCPGGDLQPGLTVLVDGRAGPRGVRTRVQEDSEVRFIPMVAGG